MCTETPELCVHLIPLTDDVRDIAKLCLVNKTFRDFLFSTIPGRSVWLKTASLLTGYDGDKVIDIRVSDFQYQLKLLVCPWLSKPLDLFFELPQSEGLCQRQIRCLNKSRLLFFMRPDEDVGDESEESFTFSFASEPCKTMEMFEKTVVKLPDDFPCTTVLLDDELRGAIEVGQIAPQFDDHAAHSGKVIHKTAFAIMESISCPSFPGDINGSIYFMSNRQGQPPKLLRHIPALYIESYMVSDMCCGPQRMWLMNSNGIQYYGPQGGLDAFDPVGQMTSAIWMLEQEDVAGAIQFMQMKGMDINTLSHLGGRTILHYAAYTDNTHAIRELIKAGANVNTPDNEHVTPLMIATGCMLPDSIAALCENGADVNARCKNGKSALLYIGREGLKSSFPDVVKVVETLIAHGANINDQDEFGQTLIFYADEFNEIEMLPFLVSKGADPRHVDVFSNTILHICLVRFRPVDKFQDLARMIANDFRVDINAVNRMGVTALSMHITALKPANIRYMVNELKADVSIKNNQGATAYDKYLSSATPRSTQTENRKIFMEICSILKC
jgi:ankyrin repeat protein